jgi:hypothetical protein
MLARRQFNVQPNCYCVLCNEGVEETIEHLFFECDFAKRCWSKLELTGPLTMTSTGGLSIQDSIHDILSSWSFS